MTEKSIEQANVELATVKALNESALGVMEALVSAIDSNDPKMIKKVRDIARKYLDEQQEDMETVLKKSREIADAFLTE